MSTIRKVGGKRRRRRRKDKRRKKKKSQLWALKPATGGSERALSRGKAVFKIFAICSEFYIFPDAPPALHWLCFFWCRFFIFSTSLLSISNASSPLWLPNPPPPQPPTLCSKLPHVYLNSDGGTEPVAPLVCFFFLSSSLLPWWGFSSQAGVDPPGRERKGREWRPPNSPEPQ